MESQQYQMGWKDKTISAYLFIGVIIQLSILFFGENLEGFELVRILGIICLLISVILIISSGVLRSKGELEEGGGFITTKLVNTGVYGIVRHPIYSSLVYLFLGFGLLPVNVITLFLGITMALLCYIFMIEEEKLTLNKFGEEYKQYMTEVPRSNLLIGLYRRIRR